MNVTVYPTKASALRIEHPSHGPIDPNGSIWPKDIFTIKRLGDGSVSLDETKKFVPEKDKDNAKADSVKTDNTSSTPAPSSSSSSSTSGTSKNSSTTPSA